MVYEYLTFSDCGDLFIDDSPDGEDPQEFCIDSTQLERLAKTTKFNELTLEILVLECSNSTSDVVCQDENTIKQTTANLKLQVDKIQKSVDYGHEDGPI